MDPHEPTLDDIAAAYVEFGRTQAPDVFWAFEAVTMLAFEQRWDALWALTLCAIELSAFDDTAALCSSRPGPLEDLIRYAAPVFQDSVIGRIRTDAKFRRALTGAWTRVERADFWREVTPLMDRYATEPLS